MLALKGPLKPRGLFFIYSQFHKTLPKSILQMQWISVRFYEMGDMLNNILGKCLYVIQYNKKEDFFVLRKDFHEQMYYFGYCSNITATFRIRIDSKRVHIMNG